MACNCKNCKFHDVDYEWDDLAEDEIEVEICEKGHEMPCDFDCPDFKKYNPKPYKEEFSECDYCQYVASCGNVIESTTRFDKQRHFIRGVEVIAKKKTDHLKTKGCQR